MLGPLLGHGDEDGIERATEASAVLERRDDGDLVLAALEGLFGATLELLGEAERGEDVDQADDELARRLGHADHCAISDVAARDWRTRAVVDDVSVGEEGGVVGDGLNDDLTTVRTKKELA